MARTGRRGRIDTGLPVIRVGILLADVFFLL